MEPKPIWSSKIFLVNAITAIIAMLTAFMGQDFVAANPGLVAWVVFGIGVLTALLRLITDQPVTLGGK